jgi:hypothetical protein
VNQRRRRKKNLCRDRNDPGNHTNRHEMRQALFRVISWIVCSLVAANSRAITVRQI